MKGRVVSVKNIGTATVLVQSLKTHPMYKKSFVRTKKYIVDDLLNVKLGDIVEFIKIKPMSKRKHWRVAKVVGRNIEEIVEQELKEKAAEEIAEVMPEEKESEQVIVDSEQSKKTVIASKAKQSSQESDSTKIATSPAAPRNDKTKKSKVEKEKK